MAKNEYDPDVARDNIRRLLELRSRSSYEVSESIRKNRTFIDDFLRGRKAGISLSSVMAISSALDVSSVYIMGSSRLPDDVSKIITKTKGDRDAYAADERFKAAHQLTGDDRDEAYQPLPDDRISIKQVPEIDITGRKYPLPLAQDLHVRTYYRCDLLGLWSFPETIVRKELKSSVEYLDIITVADDTMTDANGHGLKRGDRLLVNRLDNDARAEGFFVLRDNGLPIVRLLSLVRDSDPARIRASCLNPRFEGFEVALSEQVNIVGRVAMVLAKI